MNYSIFGVVIAQNYNVCCDNYNIFAPDIYTFSLRKFMLAVNMS